MAVDITVSNGTLEAGEPKELFQLDPRAAYHRICLDPTGPRFLVPIRTAAPEATITPLTVVVNWIDTINKTP